MNLRALFIAGLAALLSSCGGGSGGGSCDQPLTVDSVNQEVQTNPFLDFTISGTSLIHDDGDQGNTVDLLRLVLARATHPDGPTLLVAFSAKITSTPSDDTYFALYIDTDNDAGTGESINGIGADSLILDDARAFIGDSFIFFDFFDHYQTWTGTGPWVRQPVLGIIKSEGSYYEGCTEVNGMFLPLSSGVSDLSGLINIKGVMKVVALTGGDPATAVEIDSSSVFTFTVP